MDYWMNDLNHVLQILMKFPDTLQYLKCVFPDPQLIVLRKQTSVQSMIIEYNVPVAQKINKDKPMRGEYYLCNQ